MPDLQKETLTDGQAVRPQSWPRDVPHPANAPPLHASASPADRRDRARPAWVADAFEREARPYLHEVAEFVWHLLAVAVVAQSERDAALDALAEARDAIGPIVGRLLMERLRMHRAEARLERARAALPALRSATTRRALADAVAEMERALGCAEER